MAQPSVGTDLDQSAYVLINFSAQVTFGDVVPVHQLPDAVDLFFGQFIHSWGNDRIQFCLDQDLFRDLGADAIDTTKRYVSPLPVGNVYLQQYGPLRGLLYLYLFE